LVFASKVSAAGPAAGQGQIQRITGYRWRIVAQQGLGIGMASCVSLGKGDTLSL
jgi:hypothetical protein